MEKEQVNIKYFDIARPKSYINKNGETKVKWYKVGTMKEFGDKKFISLNMFENDFVVFEQKEKKNEKRK